MTPQQNPIPPTEGLAFTITGRDIWDKLSEISEAVAGVPARVEDHEVRIRVLEKKVWGIAGLASAISAGGAAGLVKILGG